MASLPKLPSVPRGRAITAAVIALLAVNAVATVLTVNALYDLRRYTNRIENRLSETMSTQGDWEKRQQDEAHLPRVTARSPITTNCIEFDSCAGTFYVAGRCDGTDHVPIKQEAWEQHDILITGVDLSLMLDGGPPRSGYAQVGNSVHPDIMAQVIGSQSISKTLSPPFSFPAARGPGRHVDIHVGCSIGQKYSAWVTLYYSVKVPQAASGL